MWEDTEYRRDKERSVGAVVRESRARGRTGTMAEEEEMKGKGHKDWKEGAEKRGEEE